jgi:hypothetical protein
LTPQVFASDVQVIALEKMARSTNSVPQKCLSTEKDIVENSTKSAKEKEHVF